MVGGVLQSTVRASACLRPSLSSAFCSASSFHPHTSLLLRGTCAALYPSACFHTSHSNMASSKLTYAKRIEGTDKNVWVEFGKLATENKALNLGQGFPDFFPPKYITDSLSNSAASTNPFTHQYSRSYGHPRLVNALAKTYGPVLGRDIDPMNEVVVTVGAYGSLFCTVQAFINPGDEAIIIEPFFDCYEPMVKVAGGTPVFIPLRPTGSGKSSADWKLNPEELASKFNANTKAIFLNNPNNPLGKVYSLEELEMIADLAKKWDVLVIADEVYEWMIYKGNKHIKIATLPGMWDRTLTIGSAGKTFSVTGWKLGWTVGPKHLVRGLQTVFQNSTYTCATPLQEAVASAFELELGRLEHKDCYFRALAEELEPKRDFMAKFLHDAGLEPVLPEGGYFMIANTQNLDVPVDKNSDENKDFQIVKWMTVNKKLAAIPPSAFYSRGNGHLAADLIRFCFIKDDESLTKAAKIMLDWKSGV